MPKYIVQEHITGSVADVRAKGAWKDGFWTLETRRKFDTGHGDDVVFARGGTVAGAIDEQNSEMDRIGDSIERVVNATHQVTERAGEMEIASREVSRSSSETAAGAGEIAGAADRVAEISSRVAHASQEARARSNEVEEAAAAILVAVSEAKAFGDTVQLKVDMTTSCANHTGRLADVVHEISSGLAQSMAGMRIGDGL